MSFLVKRLQKGLILYSEHKGLNVTVKGDADKLEQVLANLLTNAIKFTSRGNVNFHTDIQRENFGLKLEIPYRVSDCSTTSCVFVFLLRCTPL